MRLFGFRDYARRLASSIDALERVAGDVGQLVELLARPRPAPPPRRHFVSLLVMGVRERESGARVLAGGACAELVEFASRPPEPLGFRLTHPLHDATILVCCDLAQVQVDGLFVGSDLIPLNLSSGCPIGFAPLIEPGVQVAAAVRVRVSS